MASAYPEAATGTAALEREKNVVRINDAQRRAPERRGRGARLARGPSDGGREADGALAVSEQHHALPTDARQHRRLIR